MKKVTAAQLIRGQHNIDRMKKEIDQVVRMIVGYCLKPDGCSIKTPKVRVESPTCLWYVNGKLGGLNREDNFIHVECMVKIVMSGKRSDAISFGYSTAGGTLFSVETVQDVYEDLQTFIDLMLREFPDLSRRWTPLISASKVF